MRLQEGQIAPNFSTVDTKGNTISLSNFPDRKVMICFFRYAGCPFCSLQVIKLIKRFDNFYSRGLSILAFFQSPSESVSDYIGKFNPPFPLIPDPEKKVYNLYGVESSLFGAVSSLSQAPSVMKGIVQKEVVQGKIDGDLFLRPADFLIGPQTFTIKKAYYGGGFGDVIPILDIEEFILRD